MSARPGVAQRSHLPAPQRGSVDWQELAACVDVNPELFHRSEHASLALTVCRTCPVTQRCAALRGRAQGVWGGKAYYPRSRRTARSGE